jgi:2-polyprenyl-3-methyl-5-hydroxy-6-metoxy-1,4-benzoquinol methylase
VIWCGELIEHLDKPGALMGAAADLVAPDGRLVLTTPKSVLRLGLGVGTPSIGRMTALTMSRACSPRESPSWLSGTDWYRAFTVEA